ncbi:threonylcarbamoyladenosine tRNA methylthiotransferase [Nanobdella aerobiophila]|uniref:tRNA-t(6)A37 methylthiotransferase n=1 Tax=Nanobdella aerobiophila TaxID=2586965 RepID=A0A915SZX7_9ARCH|nr:tRNA (N(6)-L-threonylcarbamoyladenosine(37)-C(2))-methylthiotransferase [Nanobdella aerobiophila]BBL45529.1 threonylcarbamoyladenosine tRNA methylthiotransferase [Nanobdella aerobiophila]
MRFSLINLGCTMNKAEGEIMKNILIKEGYEYTENPDSAEVLLLNTCTVKSPTENHVLRLINKYKDKKLLLAGCLVQHQPELFKEYPLIGLDHIEEVDKVLQDYLNNKIDQLLDRKNNKKILISTDNYPIRTIILQEGCLWNCLYCATKLARGNARSYPPEYIYNELREAKLKGLKIIYFTGTDLATYGHDLNIDLADLLLNIDIKGNFFIRVGMANPGILNKFFDKLLKAYENESIFKFFHLPVQSGSDRVLRTMGRGYNIKQYHELINKIRKKFYEATISTDIIVGYPTETEEDFNKTLELVEDVKFDIINISKFWPRNKTLAGKLYKTLPGNIVKDRSKKLKELFNKVAYERNKIWLNWEGYCIIESKGKNDTWIGRNYAYKQILIKSNKNLLGKIVKVKINNITSIDLRGELIDIKEENLLEKTLY